MERKRCRFFASILAPDGLARVEPHLGACRIPLELWVSGYNGKTILRLAASAADAFEWEMDSSDTAIFAASGSVRGSEEEQCAAMQSLSGALKSSGLPHEILADVEGPRGSQTVRWQVDWPAPIPPADLEHWPHHWYGWWREYGPKFGRCPSIYTCVRPELTATYDLSGIRRYLESGTVVAATSRAAFHHPFSGKRLGGSVAVMTDGQWSWMSDLAEYVEEHGVAIPTSWHLDMIGRGYVAREVPTSEFHGLDRPPIG